MSIHDAMLAACAEVGITPPARLVPGRWCLADVTGEANGRGDGRVKLNADGRSGVAWNHQTAEHRRFWLGKEAGEAAPARDRAVDRAAEAERAEVAAICDKLIRACRQDKHPYLARKGFPEEIGLVWDGGDLPDETPLNRHIRAAIPPSDCPLLIVPGRIGKVVTTVQFITADGDKKNIRGGRMGGAFHRIATGAETWVCEGIATALTVRDALRLLGRSATVLSAFSASNVAKVASLIPNAIIAADHDKTVEQFGTGTGEFYARQTGRRWVMPPALGDWNDLHATEGLRAVALLLREVKPP